MHIRYWQKVDRSRVSDVCVLGRMSEMQGGITLLENHRDYAGERVRQSTRG